ncbi:TonB-dependent receptor [Chitinivorax sp. PXF-14]|uniref:TonB-dependent receptor plug domain-containing protein n=1 Tax=Chitinivorax sp. PXF-14 TaxID=3230488 RepID=UPI003465B2F7
MEFKAARRGAVLCAAMVCTALAWAGDEDDELLQAFGDSSTVSIATGSQIKLTRAPAVASVITAEDFAATGARDLDDALRLVPGLHVSRGYLYDPVYVIRGVHSKFNPQVLLMINGIPITSPYLGGKGDGWSGYPLEHVSRIEVIRGPGSALYGADAFSGVINIITKTAAEIDGTQVGARVASFNTREGWLQHGGQWGALDVAAYLRAERTAGLDTNIDADSQSTLDRLFHTQASLAPAAMQLGGHNLNGAIDIGWNKFKLRAEYLQKYRAGTASGVAEALDDRGVTSRRKTMANLSYHDTEWFKDWDVKLEGHFSNSRTASYVVVYPPGAFGGSFPDGMIGTPGRSEQGQGIAASGFYTGWNAHRLHIGVGVKRDEVYRVEETKNFYLRYLPGVGYLPTPLGQIVDVSDSAPFLRAGERTVRYAYLQDEWQLAKDWQATLGLRHDRYSDFGGTTNPRMALVWEAAYNLTAKLMYGQAFRAPSFVELYAINNPVAQGNPNLKPERMRTSEAQLVWQASRSWQATANLFHYRMSDMLRFVPNADPSTGSTAQNSGEQTGYGAELEIGWQAAPSLRLGGNLSWQRAKDRSSSEQDAPDAPGRTALLRADYRLADGWAVNALAQWVADRQRAAGDTRPTVADYRTLDLTVRRGDDKQRWSAALSVRNLFDANAREPSPAPGNIPNDLPLPGRNWLVELDYRL